MSRKDDFLNALRNPHLTLEEITSISQGEDNRILLRAVEMALTEQRLNVVKAIVPLVCISDHNFFIYLQSLLKDLKTNPQNSEFAIAAAGVLSDHSNSKLTSQQYWHLYRYGYENFMCGIISSCVLDNEDVKDALEHSISEDENRLTHDLLRHFSYNDQSNNYKMMTWALVANSKTSVDILLDFFPSSDYNTIKNVITQDNYFQNKKESNNLKNYLFERIENIQQNEMLRSVVENHVKHSVQRKI